MVAVLICDKYAAERDLIDRDCKRQVALLSNESMRMQKYADDRALASIAAQEQLVDLLYLDFQPGQSLQQLLAFRKQYRETMLMLITDPSVSPLEYLRPGVAPDSLMMRPINEKALKKVNWEFIGSYFGRANSGESDKHFLLDTKEEKMQIPFSQIYYFEARDKKLYVRTKNEEYAFYDTIESLAKLLPEHFQRCHRSYIINMEKIYRIVPSDNYIELTEQIGVPVSRSYKSVLMEKLK